METEGSSRRLDQGNSVDGFRIRPYLSEDQESVWDLHNMALSQAGAHAGEGSWDDDLRDIENVYLENEGTFLVGLGAEKLIAMGGLKFVSKEVAEIKRMRIHPDYQRRGFGSLLLQALECEAQKLGYRKLILDTTSIQVAAQILYHKFGYKQIGISESQGFVVLSYERELA